MGLFAQPPAPYAGPSAPALATPQQPIDLYLRQSAANIAREEAGVQRAMERDRLNERGRHLAGFIQVDRRDEKRGFVWEQTRAPSWPELPGHVITRINAAIVADRTARGALAGAERAFALWHSQHQSASQERARVKYEELTEDLLPAAQRAAAHLDTLLIAGAVIVEMIEARQQAEAEAPRERAAIEREHQTKLDQLDQRLQAARQAVQQAIASFGYASI